MEDLQQLGGNIELSGFSSVDSASMIILKKIIGNYAKHFSETCNNFERLSITLKPVHGNDSNKFEMHCQLVDNGEVFAVEHTDYNIFFVADRVCKKAKSAMQG